MSMGRLTFNVLRSFAQFEREVTGERIRDKIAAAAAAQGSTERIAEDRASFLRNVIERVIIHPDRVKACLCRPALVNELFRGVASTSGLAFLASIRCPFHPIRQGRAVRLAIGDTRLTTDAGRQAILKAIARARRWSEHFTTGEAASIAQLVTLHNSSPRFINSQLKPGQLTPVWIEKMMAQPSAMPVSLDELLPSIQMTWNPQNFGTPSK